MTSTASKPRNGVRIGVDIGGTFTDVTVLDSSTGSISLGKTLSTPDDLVRGILSGIHIAGADPADAAFIIHGSTVVINALLERKGALTALFTTKGFRDVYEIGRINRPDSFNLFFRKHVPLIPRERIFEIEERLMADGSVETPLNEASVVAAVDRALAAGVESIAILLLHSYTNPTHEQRVREIVRERAPGVFVTASHEISREYREYERTSTVAANAYVGPRVNSYLARLSNQLEHESFDGTLLIMQSSGGLCDVGTASEQCIQMMESGPASGVVGAAALQESFGTSDLICFDMGGTTAKACVLQNGKASLSSDYFVGGYDEGLVIRVPVIDIKEVGTGGGSIAWVDEGGGLHVGPESAGASPGPASYGLGGTKPTVTDANLVLGRLSASRFLGGRMELSEEAAIEAIRTYVAEPLGLDVITAAHGIIAIANAQMANAVRAVTTQRGLDPRDFTLVAYGGAGPMHAVEVARELAVNRVLVPLSPGHFSAIGMLTADIRREYARTTIVKFSQSVSAALDCIIGELENEARTWLATTGLGSDRVSFAHSADVRYVGQEHTVNVTLERPFSGEGSYEAVKTAFDGIHSQIYGHAAPEETAEIVALRVSIIGHLAKPQWQTLDHGSGHVDLGAVIEHRPVRFSTGSVADTIVYDRPRLRVGDTFRGPAIVQEVASSTTIPPGVAVEVNTGGHLIITQEDA